LHHLLTFSLFGGMIMINAVRIGAMISFIHSVTDVFGSITRIYSNTIYKNMTLGTFLLCIAVWVATRNIAFPVMTLTAWRFAVYPSEL
jgi:hypothetical protein